MFEIKLKPRICGGDPGTPERIAISKDANLCKEVKKQLDLMDHFQALLISCQVGKGKTYSFIHAILPYAMEKGIKVLYVSSRTGICVQTKLAIMEATGQSQLREIYTQQGLSQLEDFGCVRVITYHRLYWLMMNAPEELSQYGILVVDEIHALLEDALFVGFSGCVLEKLTATFCSSLRLYMTATPDDILPELAKAEAPYPIRILHMPRDYSYLVPHFFTNPWEIINLINSDSSKKKYLVFLSSIKAGVAFAEKLHCECCLLNGEERETHPEKWHEVLANQRFDEKVCIMTAIGDAGLNLIDNQLCNIVTFTTSPTTMIQVLGRKRRSSKIERVHLYAWCPMPKDINKMLHKNGQKLEALYSFSQSKPSFIRNYVLEPEEQDFRALMYLRPDGSMVPNPLAIKNLENEHCRLVKIKEQQNKDPACFDRFVCRWLGSTLPERTESWLDPEFSGVARREFFELMDSSSDVEMDETMFTEFLKEVRHKTIAAFGAGPNDRGDRDWGANKLKNKLQELDLPYELIIDKIEKIYTIKKIEEGEHSHGRTNSNG